MQQLSMINALIIFAWLHSFNATTSSADDLFVIGKPAKMEL